MENVEKDTIGLKSIVVTLLRSWRLFLYAFIFSFIPAILYLMLYPRTYEVVASVQLVQDKEASMSGQGLGGVSGLMKSFGVGVGGGSVNIEDEMAILKSNRMLRLMITDLGLNVSYSKPNSFYKLYHDDTPLKLSADSVVMASLDDEYRFKVSVRSEQINVKASGQFGGASGTYSFTSLPGKMQLGNCEFTLDFNPEYKSAHADYSLKIRCLPISWMAEQISDKIDVFDLSSASNVVEMTYTEHSKERGKDVLNTLVKKYNEDVMNYNQLEDYKTLSFVEGRLTKVLSELKAVEKEIEDYKAINDLTLLESDVTFNSETMRALQTSIIDVESQQYLINLLGEYVKDPNHKYSPIPGLLMSGGDMSMITEYNDALQARERVLQNSNETNPSFIELDNQVEMLRKAVVVMIDNAQKGYQQQLNGLKQKEKEVFSKLKGVPTQEREYRSYVRDQEILQGIYLMLLQKQEETELSLSRTTDRARVIEPAYVKQRSIGPRKLYAAIGMIVLTLIIPIGILLCRELYKSLKEEFDRTK